MSERGSEKRAKRVTSTRIGIRFTSEEDFMKSLESLINLENEGPIKFHPLGLREGESAIIMPRWVYERLLPLLEGNGVKFSRVKVSPMSSLPPEQQARLRGLIKPPK